MMICYAIMSTRFNMKAGILMLNWIRSDKPAFSMYFSIGLVTAVLAGPLHLTQLWLFHITIGQRSVDDIHKRLTKALFR